ncbi:MAG: cytochrome c oxidase subunit II [Gemmatimonadetes bacterium]|nr:cytochrome c oxidase subunit II [Gemmatimonadota bacterium]
MDEFWRLPANVSTFGADIDRMFYIIVWITGVVFVAVEVLLLWFAFRYRGRADRKAGFTHGNSRLEIAWTIGTALIGVYLGVISRGWWLDIQDPRRFPPAELELIITAKQFEWNVTYPGADGALRTTDDFVVRNQLHVPVNTTVHVTLLSEDVIHSLYLPELRLKQDAVPGMEIPVWFEATATGRYSVGCAELCGLGHYRMMGSMTVHDATDFATWTAQQIAANGGATGGPVATTTEATGGASPAAPDSAPAAAAAHVHH